MKPELENAIAVVGIAGRFPGARDVERFWDNLRLGVESIRHFSPDELQALGVDQAAASAPGFVPAGALLDDVDCFDAALFGFSPREAAILDPQHRFFLETVWEAFENAAILPSAFPGSIGVFAGSGWNAYLVHNLLRNRALAASSGLFHLKQTGNDKDVLATRVSYQFDLRGPSVNVQTACSTSLVAIHLACQSLLQRECDLALAGGVTIEIPHQPGYVYREGEILSSDGHCRSFDAASSGTVFGSGSAVVVLRRLEDAVRAGDFIHAVVLGSAINNDGARKAGFLAPSVDGQAQAVAEALAVSGVEPASIGMVEAHGTGTRVGDPIEFAALNLAFGPNPSGRPFCALGSVKSNIGHLDAAAGAAGFLKAVLALRHKTIPPSLHFDQPNPQIDLRSSPFFIPTQALAWPDAGHPRRAGVTSLGIGGTNAHIILEEAPPESIPAPTPARGPELLTLSARSESALAGIAERLASYFDTHPETSLPDAAWTLQTTRRLLPFRRAVVCSSPADAAAALRRPAQPRKPSAGAPPDVAFLFPGQGAQYAGQGAEAASRWPEFRRHFNDCCALFHRHLGLDLAAEIASGARLDETLITQPALFAVEYSLARLWMSWGVIPAALAGHSLGELVAACLAGVFSVSDAAAVVSLRARLMQDSEPGAMLAASLAEAQAASFAGSGVSLAAVNGPEQCVFSGAVPAIDALAARFERESVPHRRLRSRHAFHSPMMREASEQLAAFLSRIPLSPPAIPFLSNLTGDWADQQAATPEYWARQMTGAVLFSANLARLADPGHRVLLEAGPGRTLSSLAARVFPSTRRDSIIGGIQSSPGEVHSLLAAAGNLWSLGATINWAALAQPESPRRIPLPAYPFERQRHWIDPDADQLPAQPQAIHPSATPPASAPSGPSPLTFSVPTWSPADLAEPPDAEAGAPILVLEDDALGPRLSRWLQSRGWSVIRVRRSTVSRLRPDSGGVYHLNPRGEASFRRLFTALERRNLLPRRILYLWPIGAHQAEQIFLSLLHLAQAIASQSLAPLDLCVFTEAARTAASDLVRNPEQAVVDGPCLVLPLEAPGVRCASLDLPAGWLAALDTAPDPNPFLARAAAAAFAVPSGATAALRQDSFWLRRFEPWRPAKPDTHAAPRLLPGGCYFISGAFGALGSLLAEHLASTLHPTLILAGRVPLPDRSGWDRWLAGHDTANEVSRRILFLRRLEQLGATVVPVTTPAGKSAPLAALARRLRRRGFVLHGAFHTAGLLDDKPLRLKSASSALSVLTPKIRAVEDLQKALAPLSPGFFAVFSSISAVTPPEGQVDYAAANAFLDAWAQSSHSLAPAVSLGWGRWDAGMGAPSARSRNLRPALIPLQGAEDGPRRFEFALSAASHWVVGDHRLRGGAGVLPGTAYLDFVAQAAPARAWTIENLRFSVPLQVTDHRPLAVRLELNTEGDHSNFRFLAASANPGAWEEHCSGRLLSQQPRRPAALDLPALRSRCALRELDFEGRQTHQEKFLNFGPHWRCLRRFHAAAAEGLAELEIPSEFASEATHHVVHPSLLDLASGVALYLIPDYEQSDSLYLPFSYERITIWDRLPAHVFSRVRLRDPLHAQPSTVSVDVTVTAPDGSVLAEIESLTFKRIPDPHALLKPDPAAAQPIQPAQGLDALHRILSLPQLPPHVLVTTAPPAALTAPTPSVAAPASQDIDATLASWWEDLLGVPSVPPDLDFFEAGGHSLTAVRLFQRIKEAYHADLPLSVLFQARTVPKLAELIRQSLSRSAPEPEWSPVVEIRGGGSQQPLFLVSGAGGNVVNFHAIARHLPPGRPVFALQPPGLDGKQSFLLRIEDIAELYIRHIKQIQPSGPYLLGGYSFGGLVTYEMAQRLRRAGDEVAVLALMDVIEWHYWQSVPAQLPWSRKAALLGERLRRLALGGNRWEYAQTFLHRRLLALAHRLLGSSSSHSARVGTLEDASRFAAGRYFPVPYTGSIHLFRCSERAELDGDDPLLGWGPFAHGGIVVHEVPGNHLNLTAEPAVGYLASALHDVLAECDSTPPASPVPAVPSTSAPGARP